MFSVERSRRALGRNKISLVVLLVLACGGAESQDAESPKPTATKAPIEAPIKAAAKPSAPAVQMIEKGANKVPTIDTVAGPVRYPKDGPECPGCISTGTWVDETGRIHRTWTSSADGASIQKDMRDQLTKKDWNIQSALNQSGQFALDATKKRKRIAVLIASDGKKKENVISVIITP
jgi:hypothetical protein